MMRRASLLLIAFMAGCLTQAPSQGRTLTETPAVALAPPESQTPPPPALPTASPPAVGPPPSAVPTLAPTAVTPLSCSTTNTANRVYLDPYPVVKLRSGPGCEYPMYERAVTRPAPFLFSPVIGTFGDWLLVDLCNGDEAWTFSPAIAVLNRDFTEEPILPLTPPPLPAAENGMMPLVDTPDMLAEAGTTLAEFFDHLNQKNYPAAVELFAGGYGILVNWNSDIEPTDYPALMMRGCEWNGFQCYLQLDEIISAEQVSPMEYKFLVSFINEDGSRYGRNGAGDINVTTFLYRVVRDCDGEFYVVDWPFLEQYGP